MKDQASPNSLSITPIKTARFEVGTDLLKVIAQSVPKLMEGDVLVVTSKVVALWEKAVVAKVDGSRAEKQELAMQQADYYLPTKTSWGGFLLTIRQNILGVNAGVDEADRGADQKRSAT